MWTRKTNISRGKNRYFGLLTHYHLYRLNPNCSCALRYGRYPHFCRSRFGTYINLAVGIYIYVAECTHIPVAVGTCICVTIGTQISVAVSAYICEAVRRPTCTYKYLCGNFFPPDTLHSVGLLWASDKSDAETSTWQHTTLTRDRHPCSRRCSSPCSPEASGRRLTP
jgi:hypothetical protein